MHVLTIPGPLTKSTRLYSYLFECIEALSASIDTRVERSSLVADTSQAHVLCVDLLAHRAAEMVETRSKVADVVELSLIHI